MHVAISRQNGLELFVFKQAQLRNRGRTCVITVNTYVIPHVCMNAREITVRAAVVSHVQSMGWGDKKHLLSPQVGTPPPQTLTAFNVVSLSP